MNLLRIIFATVLILKGCLTQVDQNVEQNLTDFLFSSYDKKTRADILAKVAIRVQMNQIVDIDQKNQIMITSFQLTQAWTDTRLIWDPTQYSNITTLILPLKKLWIPDTRIINTANHEGYVKIIDQSVVSLTSDGKVYFAAPALSVKTRCEINVQRIPFDTQKCSIVFGSWMHALNRIKYLLSSSKFDLNDFVTSPLWDLVDNSISEGFTQFKDPYDNSSFNYLIFELVIKRKPMYILINGVLPCFLLNLVTVIAFILPFKSQISLIMSCFLAYSVNSVRIASDIPVQSDVYPAISVYIYTSMIFSLASMVWFVICYFFKTKKNMPIRLIKLSQLILKLYHRKNYEISAEQSKRVLKSIDRAQVNENENENEGDDDSDIDIDDGYLQIVRALNVLLLVCFSFLMILTKLFLWLSVYLPEN